MVNDLALILLSTFGVNNPHNSDLERFIEILRLDQHAEEHIYLMYVTHPIWKPYLRAILTGEDQVSTHDFLARMNKESLLASQMRVNID